MNKCLACLLLVSIPAFSEVTSTDSFPEDIDSEAESAIKSDRGIPDVTIRPPSWLTGCWADETQTQAFFKVVNDGFYYKTWSEGKTSQFQMRDASGVYPRFQNAYANPAYSRYTLNGTRKGDTSGGVFTDMTFSQGEDKNVIGVSGFLNGFLPIWNVTLISTTYKRSDDSICNVESSDQAHAVY
ncbi:hypothetical protein [Kistimonas asteriae]|uniref:hypothetical protein n=1 Tax=Kistimonas asteriae TaxID=517724 RepID=UPI001BA7113F|nr:hypothetical protein [Kistimonas asteriae]